MKWWIVNVPKMAEGCINAEFRQQIEVFAKDLEDARVSKRNIRLAELSRTGGVGMKQKKQGNVRRLLTGIHSLSIDQAMI